MSFIWVAIFGAAGVLVRYGMGLIIPSSLMVGISYTVLSVNFMGSFLGGILISSPLVAARIPTPWMAAIAVGFLGGLTTFSAVSMDTMRLWQAGLVQFAFLNLLLNNVIAILGCFLGYKIGIRIA